MGVALGSGSGTAAQVVVFPGLAVPIPVVQLPDHQPAFALTIHKSQGSEWAKVAIDLPSNSELLDRNLLYTAISRSSGTLDLYADDEKALGVILEGR
jgi:exodeoxyribonuclease V alpha subunit